MTIYIIHVFKTISQKASEFHYRASLWAAKPCQKVLQHTALWTVRSLTGDKEVTWNCTFCNSIPYT